MNEVGEMTREERVRWIEDRLKQRIPRVRRRLIAVETSRQMAAAIEANPQSLRMSARNPELGITVVERPYASAVTVLVDRVAAVDQHGRPVLEGGVVTDYDIYATLRRDR
jgi:hypothetical protein